MEEIEIVYRKISDLTLLDDNPRKISKRDLERLVDSIRINGFWKHRPIALSEREGKLYVPGRTPTDKGCKEAENIGSADNLVPQPDRRAGSGYSSKG